LVRDGNASVSSTLLRLALYRGGGVPGSVEERQRLYRGLVGSTLRISEMIDATLSKEMLSRTQLQIYEVGNAPGEGPAGGTLLFDSLTSGAAAVTAPAEFSRYAGDPPSRRGRSRWRLRIVPAQDPVDLLTRPGSRRSWPPCCHQRPAFCHGETWVTAYRENSAGAVTAAAPDVKLSNSSVPPPGLRRVRCRLRKLQLRAGKHLLRKSRIDHLADTQRRAHQSPVEALPLLDRPWHAAAAVQGETQERAAHAGVAVPHQGDSRARGYLPGVARAIHDRASQRIGVEVESPPQRRFFPMGLRYTSIPRTPDARPGLDANSAAL